MKTLYWYLHHLWMEARAEVLAGAIVGIVVVQIILGIYLLGGQPAGNLPGTEINRIVPATGEQGFNAKAFCEDRLTTVTKTLAPDASGATYELKRVKDGVSETVTVVLAQTSEVLYAKHFSDVGGQQQSQPAFVDEDVKACLEKKS